MGTAKALAAFQLRSGPLGAVVKMDLVHTVLGVF